MPQTTGRQPNAQPATASRATTDLEDPRMRRLILTDWKASLAMASRATDDLLVLHAALAGQD
jgi:hypothetical protein